MEKKPNNVDSLSFITGLLGTVLGVSMLEQIMGVNKMFGNDISIEKVLQGIVRGVMNHYEDKIKSLELDIEYKNKEIEDFKETIKMLNEQINKLESKPKPKKK